MNKFEVISKLWPSGALLDGGVDVNTVNPPGQVFTRTAPPLAPGTGAPNGYRFLFWNTGRRVTNKHQVTWTFNNLPSWTTWTATRWYGSAGGGITGGGSKRIAASAFTMEDDASMPGSPIDAANSSFTDGPAGQQAYPFGNPPDDHVASTQWGLASVAALDPFRRKWSSTSTTSPAGSGWSSAVTKPVSSTRQTARPSADPSFYSYLDASPVSIDKDATIDLMAAYRVVRISPPRAEPELIPIDFITFFEWLLDYDRLVDPFDPRSIPFRNSS